MNNNQSNEYLNYLLERHYATCHEALVTDDVTNGTLQEALEEKLDEDGVPETLIKRVAEEFMEAHELDLIAEIEARDHEAIDTLEDARRDYKDLIGV